jgi:D-glycero-D-manno-heptose 1,7-bisphosphate phosphatase
MKRPAIFFDRDNTLIACDDYLGDPARVVLVNGAADAVARARALGYATVVISNQSGVARGYFDEKTVHAVNQRMDELLAEENPRAIIDRHEFCPFHPEGTVQEYRKDSDRRKPGAGMIHSAAAALALDLSRSWVIGDAPRDIEAGAAAGCRTILFCDPALAKSPAAMSEEKTPANYVVTTLAEALDFIERSGDVSEPEAEPEAQAQAKPPDIQPVDDAPARQETRPPESTLQPAPPPPTILPSAAPDRVEPQAAAPAELLRQRQSLARPPISTTKLETIASEILRELRRRHEDPHDDFSVSKLLAGIVQVVVLAILLLSYLYRNDGRLLPMLMLAITLQTMTIALLIMGRQR